jgi:hypothetical protein
MKRTPSAFDVQADGVHNGKCIAKRGQNRAIVIDVGSHRFDVRPGIGEKRATLIGMSRCDPHEEIAIAQMANNPATEEPGPAKYRHELHRHVAHWSLVSWR